MKISEKKVRDKRSTEFKFENGAWACVYAGYEDGTGSWEFQEDEDDEDTYSEGGLWFEGKDLIDFDGCYDLPDEVKVALQDLGYNVNMED